MNKLLWKAASSRHDWSDGALLRSFCRQALRLGLIAGTAALQRSDDDSEPVELAVDDGLADRLAAQRGSDGIEWSLKGVDPAPWELFHVVRPHLPELGINDGINVLWLTFGRGAVASEALRESFASVHRPGNTEYALIHPYDHWHDFPVDHYRIPVTIGPMFQGVFWANFLGPGHLNEFELAALRGLPAGQVRWIDDEGLFVFVTASLETAASPAAEAEMLALTEVFRRALRQDSKWHL